MKLRNKKTGEMIEGKCFTDIVEKLHERGDVLCYGSLLNVDLFAEYWEEIDSPEPLIKDEKIRKAVRAWAEANHIEKDGYNNCKVEFDWGEHRLKWIETSIEFNEITGLENLVDGENYTIAELCGEEEE